jgi:hypothetical protein
MLTILIATFRDTGSTGALTKGPTKGPLRDRPVLASKGFGTRMMTGVGKVQMATSSVIFPMNSSASIGDQGCMNGSARTSR